MISAAFAAALALRPAAPAFSGPCETTGEIISNNMVLVAGSGDTVWVASWGQQGWGVNHTLDRGASWWGYRLGCYDADVADLAFGSGRVAVLLNPADYAARRFAPSKIWSYRHSSGQHAAIDITWPDSVLADTSAETHASDGVAAGDAFYFACRNGGLLRWNPQTGAVRGFLPGSEVPFEPPRFTRGAWPSFGMKSTNVFAVDRMLRTGGTAVLALTEPRLWFFRVADSSWDSSVTASLADPALTFDRFAYAFVNNAVQPPLLYAYIRYVKSGGDTALSLFRYRFTDTNWTLALKEPPRMAAGAPRGWLYAVTGANQITACRDSVSDSVPPPGGLTPAITDEALYQRLTVRRGIDKPDSIFDLAFFPVTDSSGALCIASSSGLFYAPLEVPGADTATFLLLRRDRVVKPGLKETYALPGILTDDYRTPGTAKTVFVYKLGRDANVTIRVYDFNLQPVKTVIDKAPRRAAGPTGRSTDVKVDVWDGTTASGRPVAPGVYYYKITTDTGERSFGKIVVAKGGQD